MKHSGIMLVIVMVVMIGLTGCMKPPITEKSEEVRNNETAFVIQLEGDQQAKINSLDALEKLRVTAKRIQISQRHKKIGRMWWQAEVIPTIKVIKVDRSPVTREWSAETTTGSRQKDDGIWVESMDSIGFSTGFNCTAQVTELNAATFLYNYPGGSLSQVMDDQIRNEIQSVASEVAAAYKMDECREKKLEIIQVVREKVIPKFAETGITISTIGMFGGFAYEDKEIQNSINATFVAQQAKVTAAAEYQAQEDKNRTIEKAALGLKNAAVTKAEGEARVVEVAAEAEAKAIELVARAANQAMENPVFLELKKLEVETLRIQTWKGDYPNWVTGDSAEKLGIFLTPPTK